MTKGSQGLLSFVCQMGKCLLPLVVIGPNEVLTDLHSGLSRFSILNALDESQKGRFRGLKTEGGVLLCWSTRGP